MTAFAAIFDLIFQLSVFVLFIWALVVITQVKAQLSLQCSNSNKSQDLLRQILVEIRSVTQEKE